MQNLIPFHKINWGPDDAKGDEDIIRYFVPIPEIDEIESGKIRYIIGRKGTGKTAVCEYLKQKSLTDAHCFHRYVSLRNFPLNLLRSLEDKRLADKSKYVPVWRYLLLMELCSMIKDNQALEADPIRKDVTEFLTENFGEKLGYIETLTILQERGFKLMATPQGIGFERNGKQSVTATGELHYQKICDAIERKIKQVKGGFRYYLFIDELDEGFRAGDANIRLVLLALLRAVEDLAIEFKNADLKIRPLVALRSDIWNGLNDNDLNKYDDYLTRLRWNMAGDDGAMSLRRVVNARISASLSLTESSKDWWPIFAEDADRRIPDNKTLWKYLVTKTYDRPRDILKFLKICSKITNTQRLTFKDIEQSERKYSEWLYDELKNEAGAHIPVWTDALDCLSKIGRVFIDNPVELTAEFQRSPKIQSWMNETKNSPEFLMNALFEFGAIGNVARNNYFVFRHKNEDARFDPRACAVVQFGLIKKLSLR